MDKELIHISDHFVADIISIVCSARDKAYSSINIAQLEANWLIGKRIVEQEQFGKERAEYGKQIIKLTSKELTSTFGKGFSTTNVKNFRRFYLEFPYNEKSQTLSDQSASFIQRVLPAALSWSHYERLMRVFNSEARAWYIKEAAANQWAFRTLDRNINTQYYERMLLSQASEKVQIEMQQKTEAYQQNKLEFIKNPTVLEFMGLEGNKGYDEQEIESAIITNIQRFLLEMGKGYAFVARQQLIRTEAEDYYIDLVFYNFILKCFVLIDLKSSKITHQDVGQMDMYIRMYDELKRGEGDNATIGIVLCSQTDADIARYSILNGNEQLFASKYKFCLPTEEELRNEIENQKEILAIQFNTAKDDE